MYYPKPNLKVINIVGHLLGSEKTPCAYSYGIEDPNYMLIDMMIHHSEPNTHVLTINNATRFGHNFKVYLSDPKLQISVIILLRQAIKDAFESDDPSRYIVLENIVQLVEDEAKKQAAESTEQPAQQ